MRKLAAFAIGVAFLTSSSAIAAERTVVLSVQNMYCAACPHTVRGSLRAVPGVANVTVSLQQKTAVVTYDDARTDVKALTDATAKAGYPSAPKSEAVIEQSVITCPHCGTAKAETMPTDACRFFYDCTGCGARLKPKVGDCCVFCSYGSVPCPPVQDRGATACKCD